MKNKIIIAIMCGFVFTTANAGVSLKKKEDLPIPDHLQHKTKYIVNKPVNGGEIVLTEDSKNCFDKKYMFAVDGQNKIFPGCWEMINKRLNIYYDNGERYSYVYEKKFWEVVEK